MFICLYATVKHLMIFTRYANDYLMENFLFDPDKQTAKITILSSSEKFIELLKIC